MAVAKLVETVNTDIAAKDRSAIAQGLGRYLAATYELLLSTQLVHWNLKGSTFYSIHKLTDEHYNALFATVDELAERMRALGSFVPAEGANKEFSVAAQISGKDIPAMIEELAKMHEEGARTARELASTADDADDIVTNDMLVDCIKFHEKAIWMLRASNG